MRSKKSIQTEIQKLRLVIKNPLFSEKSKDAAWASMISLQWVLTDRSTHSLGPMDLCGITMEQAIAVKKSQQRLERAQQVSGRQAKKNRVKP